ncbi:hypothetical protein EZV62_018918 [Acer yangbiense]|uniref:Uncharacterized protein n=1 Tax=Acer yangbiense TaxID=1000413 RepID=A0A5C7HAW6_9ROSI|nr:hypothetical protein EZV62_018918 [Acer yangbiense]
MKLLLLKFTTMMFYFSLCTICFMQLNSVGQAPSYQEEHLPNSEALAPSQSHRYNYRPQVRQQSFNEMQIFRKRWKNAVEEDKCWVDPYQQLTNQTSE